MFRPAYRTLFGGAVCLTSSDFKKVNGYSNEFFGWGMEDDDFGMRYTLNYEFHFSHSTLTILSNHPALVVVGVE